MAKKYLIALLACLLPVIGIAKTPDEERAEILEMREKALAQLYEEEPEAKGMIDKSEGYAVFSNIGIHILMLSTENGHGVAHDNASGKDTYMKMFSVGGGLGLGVKGFRAVFIFHTRDAFDTFLDKGWDFGGQIDAAATTDADDKKQAGALDVAGTVGEEVTVYQMTKKGLALQATLQGTKYWKDGDLNES